MVRNSDGEGCICVVETEVVSDTWGGVEMSFRQGNDQGI